jgi:hypothetical protein
MSRKHPGSNALPMVRTEAVRLREVTGICLRRSPGGVVRGVTSGDRAPDPAG